MQIVKCTLAMTAIAGLAACDPGNDIQTPPVEFQFSADFDQARLVERTPIPFRTYIAPSSGNITAQDEIRGARCDLKSQEFQASFETPAMVALPVIKGEPSPLSVSCVAGDKKQALSLTPFKPQSVVVGDPVAAVVGTMIGALVTAASDTWFYSHGDPAVQVVLE